MRGLRAGLVSAVFALAITGGAFGQTAADAAVQPAVACPSSIPNGDTLWVPPDGPSDIYNSTGYVGYAALILDKTSGCVYGDIQGNGAIPGSEVKLETSGYVDFRNVPHSWPNWVGAGGWSALAGGVFYDNYGNNWWWRACGWIGSGSNCTNPWKFTYSVQTGWSMTEG